jgi:DNA-binding MarR family transcriptional regulator
MRSPGKTKDGRADDSTGTKLPLATLLSHALVAFTIEFDNEVEHQLPHRTTNHGATPNVASGLLYRPWLVSLAMWANCMQFVGEQGIRVNELEQLAGTPSNLNGMERWGYITIAPDPDDKRAKPRRSDWVIRATPAGRMAQEIWRPLFGVIEQRWAARFGAARLARLRKSLQGLVDKLNADLPDCLPILGYGLIGISLQRKPRISATRRNTTAVDLPLSALLSRPLLTLATEFEERMNLSLAICANLLRVIDEQGVPIKDIPRLSGVSKEAISMALGFLRNRGFVVIETAQAVGRTKVARLTPEGKHAKDAYPRLLGKIEESWSARFGEDAVRTLRESLEELVGEATAEHSPVFQGLIPYPDGWRASVRKPETLPHYPMVLHRGGFPDGS